MEYHVYLIRNDQAAQYVYVGTSVNPHQRFIKHCSSSSKCKRLKAAIRKYGREHFRMEVVASFISPEEAYGHEVELVAKMKAAGMILYNLTSGGAGAPGRTVRKKTREKISESMKRSALERRDRAGSGDERKDAGDVLRPVAEPGE